MYRTTLLATLTAIGLIGCGQQPTDDAKAPATSATASTSAAPGAPCAGGAARLTVSGLCPAEAEAMLKTQASASPSAPDGCSWTVGETELAGADALIYRALKCEDKATKVAFAGGAERAELQLTESAMSGALPEPLTIGYFYTAEGDPAAAVTARAKSAITDPAEAAKCAARPARVDAWPSDAFVVDTDPNGSSTPDGSPVAVCGDLGYFDEGTRFWRVSQGYAWFFDFGQDLLEIDPGSVTVLSPGDGGGYRVFEG